MQLDRDSGMPLYIQFKSLIIEKIKSGELKKGNILPAEIDLCREYGISRYPVRQAMGELVGEGYLYRTPGKGTFISKNPPVQEPAVKSKVLGLIMGHLTVGFNEHILTGFEKQARKRGYLMTAACSESRPEEELISIDRMLDSNVSGIFIFPCDNTCLASKLEAVKEKGVYLGLLDRDPGLNELDYVGSDNMGGAYSAVRHLALQGFRNVAFLSDASNASSVNERLEGYLKAVEDFEMNPVTRIDINEDLSRHRNFIHRLFLEKLKEELGNLKKHLPLGIFAVNDGTALQCVDILEAEGLAVGRDIGIVGFDNNPETAYSKVPLTTVAQNGLLIGQNAADIAIDKIEKKTVQVYRSIVPTQLVIRRSCGEGSS